MCRLVLYIIDPTYPKKTAQDCIPHMLLPRLQPDALQWSYAASTAAAISYADRGTSAIAASSLLNELHWSESELGNVQSSFFIGYGLTQIIGGILGGEDNNSDGTTKSGGYRTVLPISLLLTGIITMLFPLAASYGGVSFASADRFCLGLLEGLLLPAAMAGISDTTTKVSTENNISENDDIKATASSLVIAGCYIGSAWAYFSAWILYSEQFQQVTMSWGYNGTIWPLVFYVNGIISIAILYLFRDEFNIQSESIFFESSFTESIMQKANNIWEDTISIANETISSKSGRAILSAQIGQGALLYSIASYSPLYLERVMPPTQSSATNMIESSATAVTAAASIAASSIILPQITQALVGVSIGAVADKLSSNTGTRTTRRSLQLVSGVVTALILWYLSTSGVDSNLELSPALLFGIAQTVSAFSLGAVSVSQLDIASTEKAGSVYALGNVAAAISGSLMVSIFGQLLDDASSAGMSNGDEFSLPFQLVALLSAFGSVIYAFTVETELEIGSNETD